MSDTNFPLTADSEFDDLPRTLRREKEARAREARERREREGGRTMDASMGTPPSYLGQMRSVPAVYGDEPVAASVRRFNVPFFHLVGFFLKCALAAIPALILFGALLYFASKGLEAYYPDLIRMKVMISFPGG